MGTRTRPKNNDVDGGGGKTILLVVGLIVLVVAILLVIRTIRAKTYKASTQLDQPIVLYEVAPGPLDQSNVLQPMIIRGPHQD